MVDSSIAHVFGFQHLMLATVRLFSRPEQWQPWFELTARNHWFWGNALNPLDTRTVSRSFAGWREFSGRKSFCSGALDSEMLIASALDGEGGKLLIAAIPTARSGISLAHDWDNMGQRQTDSGSATFERVRVEESELLLDPGPLSTPFACLRPLIAQLIFTQVFLGIAEGAFEEARQYTLKEARPWFRSNAATVSEDPYVLAHYGEFWVGLESTRLLVRRAAQLLDEAWGKGAALDAERAWPAGRGHRHRQGRGHAQRPGPLQPPVRGHRRPFHPCRTAPRPLLAQPAHPDPARPGGLQGPRAG